MYTICHFFLSTLSIPNFDNLLVEVVVEDTFNLFTRFNRFFWIRMCLGVKALFFQNVCSRHGTDVAAAG
jgi:hypothetical protein